ncbi:uncharacterized protein [Periplaneta americana]|uniref:uncharacterized protein n=1 Tax=Periplaneta americana TaxID=6978 RepID=UPI0037E751DB
MKTSEAMEPSNGEKTEDTEHTSTMATSSRKGTYKRRKGAANMRGELFELKVIALLFLRAIKTRQKFSLGSNVEVAGPFDDIALSLKNRTIFLQLKHKEKDAIYESQFTVLNGVFSLFQYCEFLCVKEKDWNTNEQLNGFGIFEDCLFVIYTNAELKSKKNCFLDDKDDWQSLIGTEGRIQCFSEKDWPDIHEKFSNLPAHKELLNRAVSGSTTDSTQAILDVVKTLWNRTANKVPRNEELKKILSKLQNFKNLSEYKDFLSKIWIFTGQKNESELDDLIKKALEGACGTDSSYNKYMEDIKKWWKKGKTYLERDSIFWKEIVRNFVYDFLHQKEKEFPEMNVRFNEGELSHVKKRLPSNYRILHFYNKECNIFSCVKARQVFGNNFLFSGSTFNSYLSQILTLWEQYTDYVLIIDGGIDNEAIVNELVGFLNEWREKSVILVTDSEDAMLRKLRELSTVEKYIDTFSMSQLDQESLDIILECNVTFQGHSVRLKSLANTSDIESSVTADILRQLLSGLEIGEKLPEEDDHYVSRRLSRKEYVNTAGNHSAEGKIYDDIKEIMELSDKVIVISGDLGMGKSTELTHFALQLKVADPTLWIVRINLNDERNVLSSNEPDLALKLLETGGKVDTEFERCLFEHRLGNEGKVIVMLDGYDEVCPYYADKVIAIIKELGNTKVGKVFVTSRTDMQHKLETGLSAIAFELMPFSEEEQKEFLWKYWKDKSGGGYNLHVFVDQLLQVTCNSLSNYKEFTAIPLLIKILAEVFNAEGAKFYHKSDVNLPDRLDLLTLHEMIIEKMWEVYYARNKKCSVDSDFNMLKGMFEQNHMYCAVYKLLDKDQIMLLKNSNSVTGEAKRVLEKLKSDVEGRDIVFYFKNRRPIFSHITFASYYAALWFSKNLQSEKDFICRHILTPSFKLVRQFFNAILARDFPLHRAVLNGNKTIVQTLLTDSCDVNARDLGGRTALHLSVMTHLDVCNNSGYEYCRFDPWNLSGNYIYITDTVEHQITSILAEHTSDLNSGDEVLSWSPIRLADQIKAWSCVDLLLGKGVACTDLVSAEESNLWHILNCCSRGSLLHLVKFIYSSRNNVQRAVLAFPSPYNEMNILITALHQAAEHGHLELVKFLLDNGADINVQTEVLKNIKYTERLAICDERLVLTGDNIQGTFVNHNIWEFSQEAHELPNDKKFKCLLNQILFNNDILHMVTPLMYAARRGHLNIVKYLVDQGADTSLCDSHNQNAFMYAVRGGHLEVVRFLWNNTGINKSNINEHSFPLHMSVSVGNFDVVKFLLETRAFDVDEWAWCNKLQMSEFSTPLLLAVKAGHTKMVELLCKHGADINIKDSTEKKTALEIAISREDFHTEEVLRFIKCE